MNAQRMRQVEQNKHAGSTLAAFQIADKVAVEVGDFRQLFLTHAALLAQVAELLA